MYVLEFLSLKVLLQKKEACGYAKVIRKREKKKELRKNGQVSKIFKTMGTQMPA
jgi:Zn ribbon nucleic-acid-binding protein